MAWQARQIGTDVWVPLDRYTSTAPFETRPLYASPVVPVGGENPITAAIIEDALRHRLSAKDGRVTGFADAADDIVSIIRNAAHQSAGPVVPIENGEAVERVARAIATGCRLDPDAASPKAEEAGHSIPEWMFFVPAAKLAIKATLASPVVPVGVSREEIAAMAWRFRGNERLGGPWYDGAKPSDSPAMHDCFAFADAILAALRPTDTGANHD